MNISDNFWIIVAGGKRDYTAKWWDPERYQRIVDHFHDRLLFVQTGEKSHFHPYLSGAINLVGKTDIRQFIRLMYHSDGVICGVTFAMHLAAAVPMRPFDCRGRPKPPNRACVVIAGGREPFQWEAYPHHQFIHNNGALPCCPQGGCWKGRCQLVGDGDEKDTQNVCVSPVQLSDDLRIARCMDMISSDEVIRRVEVYLTGSGFLTNKAVEQLSLGLDTSPEVFRGKAPEQLCFEFPLEQEKPVEKPQAGIPREVLPRKAKTKGARRRSKSKKPHAAEITAQAA